YTFPNQECEVRVGNQIKTEEGTNAGEIVEIDEINNVLKLKKGPSIKDNHPTAIIKFENISTKDKEECIIQFAEWVVENGFINDLPDYKVARHLLLNTVPHLAEPVIETSNLVEKSIDWSSKLVSGYLPIQGPPGAGKSYTGSHTIFELIKKGYKV